MMNWNMYDASKVVAQFLKPLARNEFTISGTLAFPELLKSIGNSDDYKDFFFFSQVYLSRKLLITSYIRYIKNAFKPMCKKSIFKELLIKLTKEFTQLVNN